MWKHWPNSECGTVYGTIALFLQQVKTWGGAGAGGGERYLGRGGKIELKENRDLRSKKTINRSYLEAKSINRAII